MQLKDFFNEQSVAALADAIHREYRPFNEETFAARVFDEGWTARELQERMRHITTALHGLLPPDYRAALDILRGALPSFAESGFVKIVFPDYVEVYGVNDWEAFIPANTPLSPRSTASCLDALSERAHPSSHRATAKKEATG
jgi:3-methyladenine DNA glycosylase AlkC